MSVQTHEAQPIEASHTAPTYTSIGAAWIPFAALCLAFLVEMVDNSLLTIALPTMGRDLNASTTQLQWVTGAYSLVFGSLLLTAGSIADLFGRRRVLSFGLAGFGVISAFVWLVNNASQLIAMRAVLGVAAACMAPVTMSLVFRLFDDEKVRMRAISIMVIIGMGSMAVGPVIAGTALQALSWHWLLFVNTPIALIAVLGLHFGIEKDRPEDLRQVPLDIPGALLTMVAMGFTCYSFTAGVDFGWGSPITIACFIAAIVSIAGFILSERNAKYPMIDLSILARPTVRGSALAQLGSSLAQMAVMFMLIMHFQYALGWSPMKSGLANLPFIVMMILSSSLAEKTIERYGHRITCILATVCLVAGALVLAVGVRHGYWVSAVGMGVMAMGMRAIMTVCAVARLTQCRRIRRLWAPLSTTLPRSLVPLLAPPWWAR